jgi:hypothetical protein
MSREERGERKGSYYLWKKDKVAHDQNGVEVVVDDKFVRIERDSD